MRVISIGSDRSLGVPSSASARRQIAYGMRLGDLRIIVFSLIDQHFPSYALSIETHVYPTSSKRRLAYGWSAFWIAMKLPAPDVVTVQDPFETGLVGWMIARLRRAKFHVQVHTDFCSPAFRTHSFVNRIRVRIARFIIRRADRIRVVSERIKDSIEVAYHPKVPISVLPIYVDIEHFKKARSGAIAGRFSKFSKRLLVVARLEKEKDVALAIDALAKTPQDVCLIIVGEGSQKKKLEKKAGTLGLAGRVFFEGATDPWPYYALADLILVPSKFEGYGLVIVEALAAEKPVLATDVGVAREAGAIITSSENFADALVGWIENGQQIGVLLGYPYQSFDEYADSYAADLIAAAGKNLEKEKEPQLPATPSTL